MDTDGAVAVLAIDRPAERNSMTHAMWAALPEVLARPAGVFGVTPAKVGVIYTPESTRALLDLVSPGMAKSLLFSGELVDALTALRAGLVDRLVDADDVHRSAGVLASRSALSSGRPRRSWPRFGAGRTRRPRRAAGTGRPSRPASWPRASPRSPTAVHHAVPGPAEGAAARTR